MKKYVAILLSIALMLSLVACGDKKEPSTSNDSSTTLQKDDAANENAVEEKVTDENKDVDNENKIVEDEVKVADEIKEEDPIILDSPIIIDRENYSIKITGIDPNGEFGYTINAEFENKSKERNYTFSVLESTFNGVTITDFFILTQAPGQKTTEGIYYDTDVLEKNGIVKYTDLNLTFRVKDTDDYEAEPIGTDTIHIYPYGKENAELYVRKAQPNDQVIYDNEYVTVTVIGYETDEVLGYDTNLFLVNKTDKTLTFDFDYIYVNGEMTTSSYIESITPKGCGFTNIRIPAEILEEHKIDNIESIRFLLKVYEYFNRSEDDLVNEKITINPQLD